MSTKDIYRAHTHIPVPTEDEYRPSKAGGTTESSTKPPKAESESLMKPATIIAIIGSIVSSVGIVMINKLVLTGGFPFASTLTAFHQLVSYIFSSGLILFKVIPPIPDKMREYPWARLYVSGLTSGGIVLMNQSLAMNPVAFYQLLKMSCIPAIAFLQFFLYKKTTSRRVAVTLVIILAGVGISSFAPTSNTTAASSHNPSQHKDSSDNSSFLVRFMSLIVSVGAVMATSLSQIELNQSPDFKRMNSFQSMNVMSLIGFFVCMGSAMFVDVKITLEDIMYFQLEEMGAKFGVMWTILWTEAPLGWILFSSLTAISVVLFAFSLIKGTSAITFQVVGHAKTVLTLLMGAVLFGSNGLDGMKGLGVFVALVGMVLYSKEKM
ncbi:triose-phosphate transporter family-domain-containing protein [Obelidium mucronatum]|nr:triose-phosphate transporter family-domain-containing protein [Obelidium mucronatum]